MSEKTTYSEVLYTVFLPGPERRKVFVMADLITDFGLKPDGSGGVSRTWTCQNEDAAKLLYNEITKP